MKSVCDGVCVLCGHATASTKAPVVSGGSMRPKVCNGAEYGCVLVLGSMGCMVVGLYVRWKKARYHAMCDVLIFDVVF